MIIRNVKRKAILVSLIVMLSACGGAEERKETYLEKGKDYYEAGNIEKARIEFKNVLQIDPKFSEAYYYIGLLEDKEKNIGKAMANYNKAIQLDPEYVEPKIKLAKIYTVIGTEEYLEKAKKLLAEVSSKQGDIPEALLISAAIEYKVGDKKIAVEKLESVIQGNPHLSEGVSLLSNIYIDQGQREKAVALLEDGVKNQPDNVSLRIFLAKLYAGDDKVDRAEQQLEEVIKNNPDKFSYRVALFSLYASVDQKDKAEKVLRKAIEDDKEDVDRYLMLVDYIARNESINTAEEELKNAIKANPELIDLRFALAEFYKRVNNITSAKQVLNEIKNVKEYDKDEIKANIELANIYFAEKNYDHAKQLVDKVLADYPKDNDALVVRGKLSMIYRRADDAVNDLRTVYNNDPKNTEVSKLLAAAHQLAGQDALAEDIFKKSIEINPVDPKAHNHYAHFLINAKRLDDAEKVVDKALAYFLDNYALLETKLEIVAKKGNEAELVAMLKRMTSEFPDNAKTYINLGRYYIAKKDFSKAREQLEMALRKSSDKYEALEYIVNTYLQEGMTEKAQQRINERLEDVENDPGAYFLLGKVYYSEKNMDKARDSFRKAIELQQDWEVPHQALAASYLAEKNIDKAIQTYQDAINKLGNATNIRMRLATIFERQKQYKKAMEQYREIVKSEPGNLLVTNNLASLILDNNPTPEDIQYAVELTSGFEKLDQPALLDTLGWVYVKAGQYTEAVTVLRKVNEMAPDIAVFKYHLGVALNKAGQVEEAKVYLREAVSSDQQFIGKDEASKLLDS